MESRTSKPKGRIVGSVQISVGQLLEEMLLDTLESRKRQSAKIKELRRLNARAKREQAKRKRSDLSQSGGGTTKRKAGTRFE